MESETDTHSNILENLKHRNIVQLFQKIKDPKNERIYIVMEVSKCCGPIVIGLSLIAGSTARREISVLSYVVLAGPGYHCWKTRSGTFSYRSYWHFIIVTGRTSETRLPMAALVDRRMCSPVVKYCTGT